ncbi:MAG: c-type cytochrome [Chitinophagaceae bacterium]|nr:c-type cytochrome [Chitinophagaceae bacterium]
MKFHYRFNRTILASILFVLSFCFSKNVLAADDGKTLFMKNCASCHAIDKNLTGPALQGVEERWKGNRKNLTAWIKNTQAYMKATNDPYAIKVYNDYNKSAMNVFDGVLDDKQIGDILDYVKDWKPPVAANPNNPDVKNSESDSTLLYGILTLILAIVAFTLMQVNSNLKKLTDDKEGHLTPEPIAFWKNRTYIAFTIIILVIVGGYLTAKGAIGLGRNKDYAPTQPIFYSHKVHAGINQVNCLYCHGGAQDGKHANIPSVNVCMNCHMTINEYKGTAKLYTEEGEEVNGTAEIQKLYKYANYTPGEPWDASKATPIPWTKIHNLPDHVYFNHSQHIKAGKVQCQTCHGDITKMDEVKQFSDLSMGWCINCHRETKVQFKENGFYSIYEKYHDELKSGKIDSTKGITVEKIGGTECQKCHY